MRRCKCLWNSSHILSLRHHLFADFIALFHIWLNRYTNFSTSAKTKNCCCDVSTFQFFGILSVTWIWAYNKPNPDTGEFLLPPLSLYFQQSQPINTETSIDVWMSNEDVPLLLKNSSKMGITDVWSGMLSGCPYWVSLATSKDDANMNEPLQLFC